ncbi:MAG: hypothetical protein ACYCSP_03285 [Acidobacteriaceae bacterium]
MHKADWVVHVGHEDPVDVSRRIEELVLLRLFVLFCPRIAQRQEAVGPGPALGLIEKFALLIGVGLRRGFPLSRLQLLDQPPVLRATTM